MSDSFLTKWERVIKEQPPTFTWDELAKCAKREVAQRRRVYPRLVEKGSMRSSEAARETAMMVVIQQILEAKAAEDPKASGRLL